MKSYQMINTPILYKSIIDACDNNDRKRIGQVLAELIYGDSGSVSIPDELMKIYRISFNQLGANKISDIKKNFIRILSGWTSVFLKLNKSKHIDPATDIEIVKVTEDKVYLKTFDPDFIYNLRKVKGIELNGEETLPTGEKVFSFRYGSSYENVLDNLKTPPYIDYIQKNHTQQLSFDF